MPRSGMPLRIRLRTAFLRGGARALHIQETRTVSAARPVLAVAADAERLVLPLAGAGGLGRRAQSHRAIEIARDRNSLHGTECC